MDDKHLERERYDERARQARRSLPGAAGPQDGTESVPCVLRAPYEHYENLLRQVLGPYARVLELGSGTGEFTGVLARSGAQVTASDISADSLDLLRIKHPDWNHVSTEVCDMENLPFEDASFDVVASAGSLSYGDNQRVLHQVHRLLKPGGCFVCVDSLNHNPVYRLNRYIHYLRGARSRSTLLRMPTCDLILQYQKILGGTSTVRYFGSLSWLFGSLSTWGPEAWWAKRSDECDRLFHVRKSAFKFVLMVRKGG
ncbi:MAG: class I SAM-dependent methyltransferase [Rhodoferax sp.]|nr:class I SAM-dependent methyltransferase [Rhodoferax sp.]